MKAKKCLALFLVSCLLLCSLFCLGASAADGSATDGGKISTFALVSLIVGGVVLVLVIVLCIVKREKLLESLRAYKREMKNVTWFSWKNVVRSTVFVIVCVVVIALVLGVLDYAFFQGQNLLVNWLGK